jgi:hypothetical protein
MTPAILLVTTALYGQPASNSETRFESMEACEAPRRPHRLQWCQPYARPSEQTRRSALALRMSRTPPQRHWRSYSTDPLPTGAEALDEPLNAFPSWFLRVECDRCGQLQLVN